MTTKANSNELTSQEALTTRGRFITHIVSTKNTLAKTPDFPQLSDLSDERLVEEVLQNLSDVDAITEQQFPEYRRAKKSAQKSMDQAFPNVQKSFSTDEITFFIARKSKYKNLQHLFTPAGSYKKGDEENKAGFNVGFGFIDLNGEALIESWQAIRKELLTRHSNSPSAHEAIEKAMSEYIFFDLHYHIQHEYTHALSTTVKIDDSGIVQPESHCGLQRMGQEGVGTPYHTINEVLTNYFAYGAMLQSPSYLQIQTLLQIRLDRGFDYKFGRQLANLVGDDVLEHAYFNGDPDLLEQMVNNPRPEINAKQNDARYKKLINLTDQLDQKTSSKQLSSLHSRIMQHLNAV